MTCHDLDLGSASDLSKLSISQKHYPDQDSDVFSVWNFCACSLDFLLRRNQWWCQFNNCLLRLKRACPVE